MDQVLNKFNTIGKVIAVKVLQEGFKFMSLVKMETIALAT